MQPVNLLKITTLDKDLTDKDIVMLHACFQLLVDSIEKDQLHEHTWWGISRGHKRAKKIIDELYVWWQERSKAGTEPLTAEEYEKDTEMLVKLVKIRKYLWINDFPVFDW